MTSPLLPTYARADLSFEKGEGAWLFGRDGERYLDFGAGIAVNALGHAHPHLVQALTEQAGKLWHTSNLYQIPEGERLAQRLVEHTFADMVFFSNSGAEANEAAIKMARKYHAVERPSGALPHHHLRGRLPRPHAGDHRRRRPGEISRRLRPEGRRLRPGAVRRHRRRSKAAIGPETAAILIEPIQGEGGIRPVPTHFLRDLRELCDEHGLLLIFDEIQTGIGRTGKLFAYEWTGVTPDIMAIAKGIGGGFPMGACLATDEAAKGMTVGTHGTTFGGNPLAMAVGNAVLDVDPGARLPRAGRAQGPASQAAARRARRTAIRAIIAEMRGAGPDDGPASTRVPNTEFVAAARAQKLSSSAPATMSCGSCRR